MATALEFPGVAGGLHIAFKWTAPFHPATAGITVVYHGWTIYEQQTYQWAFGYVRGDGTWDTSDEYFGANPYAPTPVPEKWELSMGGGDIVDTNALPFGVRKNT